MLHVPTRVQEQNLTLDVDSAMSSCAKSEKEPLDSNRGSGHSVVPLWRSWRIDMSRAFV
jgi:hypothetical protein